MMRFYIPFSSIMQNILGIFCKPIDSMLWQSIESMGLQKILNEWLTSLISSGSHCVMLIIYVHIVLFRLFQRLSWDCAEKSKIIINLLYMASPYMGFDEGFLYILSWYFSGYELDFKPIAMPRRQKIKVKETSILPKPPAPRKGKKVCNNFWLFRKGSLRAGAEPRITDSPFVGSFVRPCVSWPE